jgi:outer membrane receptor for ferrienterochelin and colicins
MCSLFLTKRYYITLILVLLLVHPSTVRAQGYELDALMRMDIGSLANIKVDIGSKRPESIAEAAGLISVVTRQDIEDFGGDSLMDVIERLPNVDINVLALTPTGISPNFRGQSPSGSANHTLVLLDGRPFRDSQLGAWSSPFYHAFPLDMVERIEVIRGPGSVLYGTNAFSSTVNVITRKPEDNTQDSNHVSAGYGANRTYKASASYGYHNDEREFSLSAAMNYLNSDGWDYKLTDITGRYDEAKQGQDYRGYYARGKYKNLTVGGYLGKVKLPSLGLLPVWPMGTHSLEREFLDVGYLQPLGEKWKANFNVTYNGFSNYATDGTKLIDENNFHDILYEASIAGEVAEGLNVVLGSTFDDRQGTLKLSGTHFNESVLGHYAQADYRLTDWLKVLGGVQFNKPEKEETYDVSPRLGAIVNLTNDVGVKLLYGEAFRAPTGAEVSLDIPGVRGSSDLVSEKIRTKELELFYSNNKQYYSLAFYRSDILSPIKLVSAPSSLTYRNVGRLEYKGVEFEGRRSFGESLSVLGNITYQKGKDTQSGNRDISNAPHLMIKTGASYHYKDQATFGLFNIFYADTIGYSASIGKPNPQLKNTNLMTLNANFKVNKLFDLPDSAPEMVFSVYGDNLLDQNIYSRVITAGLNANTIPSNSGRAFYANLKIKF